MNYRLLLRGDFLRKLDDYFFPSPAFNLESYAVIFLSPARSRKMTSLLQTELWLPKPEDYERRTPTFLKMRDEYVSRYNTYCADNGYSLLSLHSHPFDHGAGNFFSSEDNGNDRRNFNFFRRLVPKGILASGVMNRSRTFTARLFDGRRHEASPLMFSEILHVDYPLRKQTTVVDKSTVISRPTVMKARPAANLFTAADGSSRMDIKTDGMFDRQIRVFGKDGQELMGKLRVCMVGVGGLGSVLAEILVRLGIRDFTLIDDDVAGETNLNRFSGMYYRDVDKKRPKVRIARRLIRQVCPTARVRMVQQEVYVRAATNALKEADVVFICTDNVTSRDFVNKFCVQYTLPCISLGSVIQYSKEKKRITAVLGEVLMMIPGSSRDKFCLMCAGAINTDMLKLENTPGNLAERVRGYVLGDEEPAPAVRYLNGVVADLAAAEFHNLVCNFKAPVFHQRINLMPQKMIADDFFADDFQNFLGYLQEEGIITKKKNKAFGNAMITAFTVVDAEGRRLIKQDIPTGAFAELAVPFVKKGIIPQERQKAFLDELEQYFSVQILQGEQIVSIIDVRQEDDECPICGPNAYRLGMADLGEKVTKVNY